ncbi:MAG: DMT family transporter [Opitutaceae bacterium]|nr:DMT family transporter [Opitutaceae bacterium]
MPIGLALISSVLWGSADFQGGRLAKKHSAFAVTGLSQVIGLVCGLVVVALSHSWKIPNLEMNGYFISGICAGIAGYLGLSCLYAGLATGRMGVVSPISSLSAIIPATYAIIQGEKLLLIQGIGIIIALAGAFFASGPEISQGFSLKPLALAVGAALGFGVSLTFMAKGSVTSALMTMVMMRVATLCISLSLALRMRTIGGFQISDLPSLALVGVADFSANLLIGVASTRGLVSVVMVIGSLFPIMTALLAFKILHERLHKIQYVGIALAVTGIALISSSQ